MAQITFRRRGELLRGVLKILKENPDGLPAKEVLQRLYKDVPPTPFEDSCYPNHPNIRRYERIVRFSTIPLVKAGWMEKNKGQWSITEDGGEAYEKLHDPEEFGKEAVKLYREWKRDQPETEEESEDSSSATATLEEAEESAWTEIEEYLREMNPYDFQDLVAGLLESMDYHVTWVAPPGPDRGVDIIAHPDPLGVRPPRVKVQVKRRQDKITVEPVRSFMSQLGDGDIGLFVSSGGFTKDAELEARTQEKRHLTLVDLRRLFDLWVTHYSSIPESKKQLLPLRQVYFLSPRD